MYNPGFLAGGPGLVIRHYHCSCGCRYKSITTFMTTLTGDGIREIQTTRAQVIA